MNAPKAKKIPFELTKHNHTRIDDYYWLREKENQEVIDYLNAENKYCEFEQKGNEQLRKDLFNEMKGRIKEDDASAPYFSNGYYYYSRNEEGKELSIYCRKKETLDAEEEILIDENNAAKDHEYYEIVSMTISLNNNLMVFAEDLTGRRKYNIRLLNLTTREYFNIPIKNTSSGIVWHSDNETFYFVQKDEQTLRSYQIKSYNITTGKEKLIYTEADEKYACSVFSSKDDQHILFGCFSTMTTEIHYKSALNHDEFKCFLERKDNHEYSIDIGNGQAFIKTNINAKNFELAYCSINSTAIKDWKIIQLGSNEIYLEDFELFHNYIVVQEKKVGLAQLGIYNLSDFSRREIPVDEETYSLYFGVNEEYNLPYLRIGYTSLTKPSSVYTINLKDLSWKLLKQQPVIGEFNSVNYKSERKLLKARDGINVPCSLVYKKDCFKKDGTNPILLYAYGSYGNAIDPYFSSLRLSLLERGFIFAIAHIRGGDDLGYNWYEEGKLLKKKNTFTDFIDVAEGLIKENYCSSKKLFAMGGSAGGLLMGAIANMRPELWAGIVSQVPFVDVVTTMLDDTIPLTTGEYDEWGNPNEKTYYDYMLSYSPYDQIKANNYPPTLVISGLNDSQVQYWEPTKYVAKLRAMKTDNNSILLRTNMEAGHGGSAGRYEAMKEVAFNYAYIIDLATE